MTKQDFQMAYREAILTFATKLFEEGEFDQDLFSEIVKNEKVIRYCDILETIDRLVEEKRQLTDRDIIQYPIDIFKLVETNFEIINDEGFMQAADSNQPKGADATREYREYIIDYLSQMTSPSAAVEPQNVAARPNYLGKNFPKNN